MKKKRLKKLTLKQRVEKIEEWIDIWEGVGAKAFDSGWVKYRKSPLKGELKGKK